MLNGGLTLGLSLFVSRAFADDGVRNAVEVPVEVRFTAAEITS